MSDLALPFETVVPGLEIARGACNDLAGTIHEELERAQALPWEIYDGDPQPRTSRIDSTKEGIVDLVGANVPTLELLLKDPVFDFLDLATINKQPAMSMQAEHTDSATNIDVHVIHFSPLGIFDYRQKTDTSGMDRTTRYEQLLADDKAPLEELRVGVGDIVHITDGTLRHRGRNPSSKTRFNLVLAIRIPYMSDGEE